MSSVSSQSAGYSMICLMKCVTIYEKDSLLSEQRRHNQSLLKWYQGKSQGSFEGLESIKQAKKEW